MRGLNNTPVCEDKQPADLVAVLYDVAVTKSSAIKAVLFSRVTSFFKYHYKIVRVPLPPRHFQVVLFDQILVLCFDLQKE